MAYYFAGDVEPDNFEEEFALGLQGKSEIFKLCMHYIFAAVHYVDYFTTHLVNDPTPTYCEILGRGGGTKDTAAFKRYLAMTPDEKKTLTDTTVRIYGNPSKPTCSMNLLSLDHLPLYEHSGMIIEIHESLILSLIEEMISCFAGELWVDDVPIDNIEVVNHLTPLLKYFGAIKLGTVDLAKAFGCPIVKNPVDAPDKVFQPAFSQELQDKMLHFVARAYEANPKLKLVLELIVPLEPFLALGVPIEQMYIQGAHEGARVYYDPDYCGTNKVSDASGESDL